MVVSDLYTRVRALPLAQRFSRSAFAAKVTKYAIGSVIALLTSIVAFALLYVTIGNTTVCSIGAFLAGAIPNWILNRRWAWKIKGQVSWMREVLAYTVISLLVLVASAAVTGWTNDQIQSIPAGHGIRVILVTASYVFVQAVFFVMKFLVYEHWVFAGRSRLRAAVRSRHQVWTAARANRTP